MKKGILLASISSSIGDVITVGILQQFNDDINHYFSNHSNHDVYHDVNHSNNANNSNFNHINCHHSFSNHHQHRQLVGQSRYSSIRWNSDC